MNMRRNERDGGNAISSARDCLSQLFVTEIRSEAPQKKAMDIVEKMSILQDPAWDSFTPEYLAHRVESKRMRAEFLLSKS